MQVAFDQLVDKKYWESNQHDLDLLRYAVNQST